MSAQGIARALVADCANPAQRLVLIHIGQELDEDHAYRFCPDRCEVFSGLDPREICETFDRLVADGAVIVWEAGKFGVVVTLPEMPSV
jgi:hypothetical protein